MKATAKDVRLEPSRIAQGIVTGVGFLGAGVYVIGVAATLIILIMQFSLHRRLPFVKVYKTKIIRVN